MAWPLASHGNHCYINSKKGDIQRPHNIATSRQAKSIVRPRTDIATYIPPPSTTCFCTLNRPTHYMLSDWSHQARVQHTPVQISPLPHLLPHFTPLPMKMELTEGSETSAYINQMPGNYPKGNLQIMLYIVTAPYSCYTDLFPNITHLTSNFVLFQ
jgi:hypothetical protein